MNNMLSLQHWNPETAVAEIDFTRIPMWVQIHGLPLGAMTVTNATKMTKLVGEVLEIEDTMVNGVLLRCFMRARVNFNTLRPLPTGCWVPRKHGPKSWVMFLYEKLQGFCYTCGVIGHEQKDCREAVKTTAISKEIPLYGAKLSVPPAKPMSLLIKEQQRWRNDKEKDRNGPKNQPREGGRGELQGVTMADRTERKMNQWEQGE